MINLKGMEDRERGRKILNEMGLAECVDCLKCQSACPREIEIFGKIIEPIKLYFSL